MNTKERTYVFIKSVCKHFVLIDKKQNYAD